MVVVIVPASTELYPSVFSSTNSVVANCVVFVPSTAVGAKGVPVNSGESENTANAVPVSSVKAVDKLVDVKEPNVAALPTDVTSPVRLVVSY